MAEEEQVTSLLFQNIETQASELTVILFLDVTSEEKLFKKRLEEKYKNIFLSSNSHQLRTPLNSISYSYHLMNFMYRPATEQYNPEDHMQEELGHLADIKARSAHACPASVLDLRHFGKIIN
jgi:signal transduction histidine kinase